MGGASAAVAPITDVPRTPLIAPGHEITLGEEEISDVSLATFYVFDKENTGSAQGPSIQETHRLCCKEAAEAPKFHRLLEVAEAAEVAEVA